MTQPKATEKDLDRIAKLLRMSKDVSSPEEAAVAAERARKLMDKFQLEEAEINLNSGKSVGEDMIKEKVGPKHEGNPYLWVSFLITEVAKYNDCHGVVSGGRTAFMGYKTDVFLAKEMYTYLIRTIEKMSENWVKQQRALGNGGRFIGDSYRKGAALAVIYRLRQAVTERDTKMSDGRELMVVKRDAVDQYFGKVEYKVKDADIRDEYAESVGYRHGQSISLHKQVGN